MPTTSSPLTLGLPTEYYPFKRCQVPMGHPVQSKDKVHTVITFHEGTMCEQIYRTNVSSTSALDRIGSIAPRPGRFTHGNDPVPIA